jgi:lysophospholipase L1-like esterase
MKNVKFKLKQFGLYTTIIVATLVAAESIARIIDWKPQTFDGSAGDGLGPLRYYHSPTGLGDLVPNQNGLWVIWFHRPYNVQTDSVGFRDIEEPDNKLFQILAVGDSQTFGPYLANEDTWPAWTQVYLGQYYDSKEPRVRVFNAGIAGYTILDELSYFREKGIKLKPRLVVLAAFENDIDDLRKEKNGVVQRPRDDARSRAFIRLKALVRSSALFSVAQQIRTHIELAAAGVDILRGESNVSRPNQIADNKAQFVERYQALFRETVSLLKAHQIPLAVVFIPAVDDVARHAPSEVEPVVRDLTTETNTPYLDLTPTLRNQPDAPERLYLVQKINNTFIGNGHLSREGHAVIARAVADWLVANKLVPPNPSNLNSK